MDIVLKLREIRLSRGLSQKDVARLSGIGDKTISALETQPSRATALKVWQLARLLDAYGTTLGEFFAGDSLTDSSIVAQVARLRNLAGADVAPAPITDHSECNPPDSACSECLALWDCAVADQEVAS